MDDVVDHVNLVDDVAAEGDRRGLVGPRQWRPGQTAAQAGRHQRAADRGCRRDGDHRGRILANLVKLPSHPNGYLGPTSSWNDRRAARRQNQIGRRRGFDAAARDRCVRLGRRFLRHGAPPRSASVTPPRRSSPRPLTPRSALGRAAIGAAAEPLIHFDPALGQQLLHIPIRESYRRYQRTGGVRPRPSGGVRPAPTPAAATRAHAPPTPARKRAELSIPPALIQLTSPAP